MVSTAVTLSSGVLEHAITSGGQYVLVLADAQPVPPPVAVTNALLLGVDRADVPAALQSAVTPDPRVLFASPEALSLVTGQVTTDAALTSGLPLQVRLVESYRFLDGEECRVAYGPRDGLHGSRHLARQLVEEGRAKDVRAVLVLDMVGDRDLTFTLPRNQTPALLRRLLAAARAENVRERCRLLPHDVLDDHEPFLRAGLPAALLMDFEYGRAPGLNDYWHTAEDRLDKLSAESLTIAGRVAVQFVNNLLTAP